MNLGSLGKVISISKDVASNNGQGNNGAMIASVASTVVGAAFPPAGMVMGLLQSTGIMDSLFSSHPEEAKAIQSEMDKFDAAVEQIMEQARNIDRYVDHLSDEQVDQVGQNAGYF